MTINNIIDFAEYKGIEVKNLKRDLYRYTDVWFNWGANGVVIGTAVENSNVEFSVMLKFPFTSDEFEKLENRLEKLAYDAWCEVNEE